MGRVLQATLVLIRSSVAAEVAASERFLRRRLATTAVRTHPPDADVPSSPFMVEHSSVVGRKGLPMPAFAASECQGVGAPSGRLLHACQVLTTSPDLLSY